MNWTTKKVLELMQRADLSVERAERLGIDDLHNQVTLLRHHGYKIQNIEKGVFRYAGKKEAEPKQ